MKEFKKDGPKRRRATRRETSPVSRQGFLPGVDNFKAERQKRRDRRDDQLDLQRKKGQ